MLLLILIFVRFNYHRYLFILVPICILLTFIVILLVLCVTYFWDFLNFMETQKQTWSHGNIIFRFNGYLLGTDLYTKVFDHTQTKIPFPFSPCVRRFSSLHQKTSLKVGDSLLLAASPCSSTVPFRRRHRAGHRRLALPPLSI